MTQLFAFAVHTFDLGVSLTKCGISQLKTATSLEILRIFSDAETFDSPAF